MNKAIPDLVRQGLAGGVRMLSPLYPILPERLRIPRRSYDTAGAWFAARGAGIAGITMAELDPAQSHTRAVPGTIDERVHWMFDRCRTDGNWGTFVLRIPGGRAVRDDAVAITPDGCLLGDVCREVNTRPREHSLLRAWRLPPVCRVRGRVAVLNVVGGNLYFHWMFDLLPRFDLLRRAGVPLDSVDRFLVNGFAEPFQKETLARLGIPEARLLVPRYETHLSADELVVPSLPGTSGNMLKSSCEFLRREFLPRSAGATGRIYVRRGDAAHRRVKNEDEVERFLAGKGFRGVTLTGMPVRDQAALFAGAEAVVACHGAGLTNMVFCAPRARVVEIFSPNYVNVCYYVLASRVGVDYHYLLGEGPVPPGEFDPHAITEDVTVEMERLGRILRKAGL